MLQQANLRHVPNRFPLACQWEITCRCNLRCVMCYTDCRNTPEAVRGELRTDEMLRILDELLDAGTLELCVTGGEPFSRPDFFELYDRAVSRGLLVTVFTNGTLITEAVADRLASLPPHRIEISLHGTSAPVFERITQAPGSHPRCLNAIRLLLDRRIPLVLKATAMTLNQDEIFGVKAYAHSVGAAFRLGEELRPELDGGAGPFRYALTSDALDSLNRQDPAIWAEACRRSKEGLPPCTSGMQRFHIDAYGSLSLCSGNRQRSYDLRRGSFREGFYDVLPTFPCPWKAPVPAPLLQPEAHHV